MSEPPKEITILVVEDNPGDFILIEEYITEKIPHAEIINANSLSETKKIIESKKAFDIVLLDLSLPDSSKNNSIKKVLSFIKEIPVIVLTGFSDSNFGVESLSLGVYDYLLKDDLTANSLYKSITYSLERQRINQQLKLSERRFRALVQDGADLIGILDIEGNYIYVSPTSETILGIPPEDFIGKNAFDFIHPNDKERVYDEFMSLSTKKKLKIKAFRFQNHQKKYVWIETIVTNMLDDPAVNGIVANSRDITEQLNYEQKISQAVINTQETERFEISSELHDNVNQLLAASQIYLSTASKKIEKPFVQELVNNSRSYVLSAISEIRKLSHRLSPGFQSDFSILEALKDLTNDLDVESKLKVTLEIDKKHIALPYDLKLNLYRILQEQFINILKHSGAKKAKVELIVNECNLKMITSDNGNGFTINENKKGIGLNNMKKRVSLFLGSIEIKSDTKTGTKIIIDIPL